VKLDEPNYFFIWKKELKSWFGLLTEGQPESMTYSKMQKGLCTELVFSILTLITEHSSGETKKSYKDYDFDNISSFTLENLFIQDIRKFIGKEFLDTRRAAFTSKKSMDFNKKLEDVDIGKLKSFRANTGEDEQPLKIDLNQEFMIDK
jgi:hypothetical protein